MVGIDLDGVTAEGESFEGMVHDGLQKRETAPTREVSRGKGKPAEAGCEVLWMFAERRSLLFLQQQLPLFQDIVRA